MKSILRNLQGYPSPLTPSMKNLIMNLRPAPEMSIGDLRREIRKRNIRMSLDMCPNILECINPNYKPVKLSRHEERTILGEFYKIVTVFSILQKGGAIRRKNFLSYHFVISKIISRERLSRRIRKFLILPKCKTTMVKQEREWRKIRAEYTKHYSISS